MEDYQLHQIVQSFRLSIPFVDFRTIYIEDKGKINYILTTFRFTADDLESIKFRQRELETIISTRSAIKFQFEAIKFEDWLDKWNNISQNRWDLKWSEEVIYNRNFRSPSVRYFNEKDYDNYCSIEIYYKIENPDVMFNTVDQYSKVLRNEGISDIYKQISRFHEIGNYNKGSHLFVMFLIPIPLKIYFDTTSFYNNYFYTQFKFHRSLLNSSLFIEFTSADEIFEFKHKKILDSHSSSLKELGNSFFQDEIYFRVPENKTQQLGKEARFNLLMPYEDFEYIINYKNHLKTIVKKSSKLFSMIPKMLSEVFSRLNNIFDLSISGRFLQQRNDYLRNISIEQIEEFYLLFERGLDWLLTQNSKSLLIAYSEELANKKTIKLYNIFRDLLIIVITDMLYSNRIREQNLKNKLNDIIIKFGLTEFDNYAILIYTEKPLLEFKQEISRAVELIYHNVLNCKQFSSYNNQIVKIQLVRHIIYPKRYSKCILTVDKEIFCYFHLFLNDPNHFRHNSVFISVDRLRNRDQMWENLESEDEEKLTRLFEKILDLDSSEVIGDIYLPVSISSKLLENYSELSPISEEDSKWINQYRFCVRRKDNNWDFEFSNFNIFIGKNNSGKSLLLTLCYNYINSGIKFDYPERAERFIKNHSGRIPYDMYYIPEKRVISESSMDVRRLKQDLTILLDTLSNLQSDKYLKLESSTASPELSKVDFWKIPDLLRLVDLCLILESDEDALTEEGRKLFSSGNKFFKSLKKIYKSWKHWIEFFFPDIKVNQPHETERGRLKIPNFNDSGFNVPIANWKWFGSGTQQLLNLIFLIEFLKYSPTIDYKQASYALRTERYDEVFSCTFLDRNCRILFIDEPEVSLHPGLQKKFFQYLYDSSKFVQIFIATQSPFFLDISNFSDKVGDDINLILCQKNENRSPPLNHIIINKNDILLIYDEIFEYSVREAANLLTINDYYYLSIKKRERSYDLKEMRMVKMLFKYVEENSDYKEKLLDLGRTVEDFGIRMIQNAVFLCTNPQLFDLGNFHNELKRVFFNQYLKSPRRKKNRRDALFSTYLSIYDQIGLKNRVLYYKDDTKNKVIDQIRRDLETSIGKIINRKTMFIFQENVIPYDAIEFLIEFASKHEIIILGGLEHIKVKNFFEFIENLPSNIKSKYLDNGILTELIDNRYLKNTNWINQAIIINGYKKFSFQLKNIPFHHHLFTENISTITPPKFSIFKTIIGNIAIFICKDFLVNYPVIDKWMDIHDVQYVVIPSNSMLVNPFIRKFGEIINYKKNKDKHFFFVNIAEFGGSGMFSYKNREDYEPGGRKLFSKKREGIESMDI